MFTGDPVFAGLHRYEDTDDDRSYRNTAHVVHPFHMPHRPAAQRRTIVILPEPRVSLRCVVHEYGHVLHYQLGRPPGTPPVTEYAETNHREAFAEAFAAWVLPFGHSYGAAKDRLWHNGRRVWELFETLAAA